MSPRESDRTDADVLFNDMLPSIARIDVGDRHDLSASGLRERHAEEVAVLRGLQQTRARHGLMKKGAFKLMRARERVRLLEAEADSRGVSLDAPMGLESDPREGVHG